MAQQLLAIEAMTDDDCTFSVGIVHGGKWVNCVASNCTGEALSMAKRQADLDAGVERMMALNGTANDVTFKVTRGVTRPVWEPNAGTMALYEKARAIASGLGIDLTHDSAGGGSDGNFTGAMGIATLDGLGVVGADMHTLGEYIEIESLVTRGRLMAGHEACPRDARTGDFGLWQWHRICYLHPGRVATVRTMLKRCDRPATLPVDH
eukprot:gene7080-9535_t